MILATILTVGIVYGLMWLLLEFEEEATVFNFDIPGSTLQVGPRVEYPPYVRKVKQTPFYGNNFVDKPKPFAPN